MLVVVVVVVVAVVVVVVVAAAAAAAVVGVMCLCWGGLSSGLVCMAQSVGEKCRRHASAATALQAELVAAGGMFIVCAITDNTTNTNSNTTNTIDLII